MVYNTIDRESALITKVYVIKSASDQIIITVKPLLLKTLILFVNK